LEKDQITLFEQRQAFTDTKAETKTERKMKTNNKSQRHRFFLDFQLLPWAQEQKIFRKKMFPSSRKIV
jgi:hypothetical protein